jgi:protein-disulfide isomerase-like protein with CxxC motif
MAKLMGTDMETPKEAQERILKRIREGGRQFANQPIAQFGYNLATALGMSFGGMGRDIEQAEDRIDAVSTAQKLDERSVEQHINHAEITYDATKQAQAQRIADTLSQQGANPDQIKAVQAQHGQAMDQQRSQIRSQATVAGIEAHTADQIAKGVDPENAQLFAMANAAHRLSKLGGAENLTLANQIRSQLATAATEKRVTDLQVRKLSAEVAGAEQEAGLYGSGPSRSTESALAKLQYDRQSLLGMIQNTDDPQKQANLRDELMQMDQRIEKETGASPSAALIKEYGIYRKSVQGVDRTAKLFEKVLLDEDTKTINPEKALVMGRALTSWQDNLLTLEIIGEGLGLDALSSHLRKGREGFIDNLTAGTGISKPDAVRIFQEVQGSVIAQARAMGGPITESDLEAALAASGVSSGRLDLFLEKQVNSAREAATGIGAEADIYGTKRFEEGISSSAETLDNAMNISKAVGSVYTATAAPPARVPVTTGGNNVNEDVEAIDYDDLTD